MIYNDDMTNTTSSHSRLTHVPGVGTVLPAACDRCATAGRSAAKCVELGEAAAKRARRAAR